MERFSFFNDVDGDRVYYAEDFARHLQTYFTNGIFNNGCQILANTNDMSVNVSIGSANINGYRYDNDAIKTLMIENADGVLNRIDNIVIRWDLTNRTITTQVIKGAFADNPVAPDLVRTSTIYDLRIAKISVPSGTIEITQDLVTDTRFDTNDCGNVISTVQTPDTTDIFAQYDNEFHKWFETVKEELTNTPVGNLQSNVNSILEILGLDVDTYSSTKTYALEDLVVYNHKIYACTTAIETPEEWNEAKWEFVPFLIEENEESEEEI